MQVNRVNAFIEADLQISSLSKSGRRSIRGRFRGRFRDGADSGTVPELGTAEYQFQLNTRALVGDVPARLPQATLDQDLP